MVDKPVLLEQDIDEALRYKNLFKIIKWQKVKKYYPFIKRKRKHLQKNDSDRKAIFTCSSLTDASPDLIFWAGSDVRGGRETR